MSVGKRTSTAEPLTEHDVAERIGRSMLRTLTIMQQARDLGLMPAVKSSRYYALGLPEMMQAELEQWTS